MIIRKVDKGSMVIGGAVLEDNNGYISEGKENIYIRALCEQFLF